MGAQKQTAACLLCIFLSPEVALPAAGKNGLRLTLAAQPATPCSQSFQGTKGSALFLQRNEDSETLLLRDDLFQGPVHLNLNT